VIADEFPSRTACQISAHWQQWRDAQIKHGAFTEAQDDKTNPHAKAKGDCTWQTTGHFITSGTAKQYRERWTNCFNPQMNKGPWTPDEDQRIDFVQDKAPRGM
jgi:hypothetical protein